MIINNKICHKSGLIGGFLQSCNSYPKNYGLFVNKVQYKYNELLEIANKIVVGLTEIERSYKSLAAFLGYRSIGAYSSILGILLSGRGYVSLNPNLPIDRIAKLINMTEFDTIVVCEECFSLLPVLLPLLQKRINFLFLDFNSLESHTVNVKVGNYTKISTINSESVKINPPIISIEDIAYLIFTSGSTGIPKGVPISHKNVMDYIEYTCNRYRFNENDRFSQTADMSFDLSILEIFPCWASGACLYCIPKSSTMLPGKFIRDNQLTVWISVPSVGVFMDRMHMMKPNAYPSLLYCLFDGEPLLASTANKWQSAANNAVIENLYGPTEATVAIADYRWQGEESMKQCVNGIVPIGAIFKGQFGCIVDEKLCIVRKGTKGELCLAGSQVSKGYYNDPEKSKEQFVTIGNDDKIWYRTGDLVVERENGCLNYLGRIDNQVKILGYRVELQEIDNALRIATGEEFAAAVAWPKTGANAEGIVGFVPATCKIDKAKIVEECRKYLPDYMAPANIHFINSIPFNSNGKIDRLKLSGILDKEMS